MVTAILDGELPCTHNATKSLDKNWNYENYSLHRGKSYNFFVVFIKILINAMAVKVI